MIITTNPVGSSVSTTITSSGSLQGNYITVVVESSCTVTLPDATGYKEVTITSTAAGVVTVNSVSGQTISGLSSVLLNRYDTLQVRSNNNKWVIV